ncbi:MAG: GWxTD domain-containing protein [bacterium]|nr:GWxTD domain-containing protein [bacterium]
MFKRTYITTFLALVLLVTAFGSSQAQFAGPIDATTDKGRSLYVDYAYFRSIDPEMIRLDLYYQIFNRGLEFREENGKFVADYELVVAIDDDDGQRLETITRDRRVTVESERKTRSYIDHRTSQVNIDLPEGKYKVKFTLKDVGSGRTDRRDLKVKLESLQDRSPLMSGVEFVQAFSKKGEKEGVFDKSDLVLIPSVTRTFGREDDSRLVYYFEIYPGWDSISPVVVETKIRHAAKGMKYRDTLHLALGDQPTKQLREISLGHFTPGEYELEIILRGRRNKKLVEQRHDFEILWTLDGMIRNDWKSAVKQLELYSDNGSYLPPDGLDEMEDLETTEERKQAFDQFWLERDPTPGTAENEFKRGFYYRIALANDHFGMHHRAGWKTDRGRVLVRYGEPDQVDDVPFSTSALPYQVWLYYTSGRYREFLFVDENQDGEYRLQFPYDGVY